MLGNGVLKKGIWAESIRSHSRKRVRKILVILQSPRQKFMIFLFTYFLKFYYSYVWVHRQQVLLTRLYIDRYTYKCILSLQAVHLKYIKYCNLKHAWLLARNNSWRCCHCTSHQAALHAQCLVSAHKHLTWGKTKSKSANSGPKQCPLKWPELFHERPRETFMILAMMSEFGWRKGPLCEPYCHNPDSLQIVFLSFSATRYLHLCNTTKKSRDRRYQDESGRFEMSKLTLV